MVMVVEVEVDIMVEVVLVEVVLTIVLPAIPHQPEVEVDPATLMVHLPARPTPKEDVLETDKRQ